MTQRRSQEALSDLDLFDDFVRATIEGKDDIGWRGMKFGTVHQAWNKEQGDYFVKLGRHTTGTT